jgi:putative ABC transport system permease protein
VIKYLPLIWRNLGRNRTRSALTAGAIALAIALVCVLRTMPAGLDTFLNQLASNTRISVHNKAGIVYSLPYAYLQKVRSVPGVVAATSWTWFGGSFEKEKGVTFPNFAVDPDTIGVVYADHPIPKEALAAFERQRDAALVGLQTLEKYGWKPGDRIALDSTVFPLSLEFQIVGGMGNRNDPRMWIHREYLTQALAEQGISFEQVGIIWARVDDPERVGEVIAAIDAMFHNSEAETATETEKSFFGNFFASLKGLVTIILLVTALVTLCIVFIAANTASMSVRERVREIAVMKALGFRWRLLFGMLVLEAALLSTLAGAVGVGLSWSLTAVLQRLAGWNQALGPLAAFLVSNAILVQGLFLALFIGILAGVVPAWGASRKSVAATLREVF